MDCRIKSGNDDVKKRSRNAACVHFSFSTMSNSDELLHPARDSVSSFSSPPGIAVRKNGVASLAYDPVVHAEPPHGLPGQARQ
jgi:hypothetical protein